MSIYLLVDHVFRQAAYRQPSLFNQPVEFSLVFVMLTCSLLHCFICTFIIQLKKKNLLLIKCHRCRLETDNLSNEVFNQSLKITMKTLIITQRQFPIKQKRYKSPVNFFWGWRGVGSRRKFVFLYFFLKNLNSIFVAFYSITSIEGFF